MSVVWGQENTFTGFSFHNKSPGNSFGKNSK